MSNLTTLARPYAKAAFDLAHEAGELGAWGDALALAALVVSEEAMADWLQSPEQDTETAIGVIEAAAGRELDPRFRRFLGAMGHHDRLSLLPEVVELFAELREAAENRLEVKVVSAVALDDDQKARMSEALSRRFDRVIELRNEVDASVLGGAVIYAGDEVIDGSLRGRLARLEGSLH
jgi:F-type H+-transporting ATPase subunit delta